jgi:hypothetical protein
MKATSKLFKFAKKTSRSGAVVNYTRPDLTNKWLWRIQQKAGDSQGVESASKLSSLVDFYAKKVDMSANSIDWAFWKQNIRTEGVVEKIEEKNKELSGETYNVDALAARSAHTSEKYENYSLFLKYNHDLWRRQYTDNLDALYGLISIGDPSMTAQAEFIDYHPGSRQIASGWRETGFSDQCNIFYNININNFDIKLLNIKFI